MDIRLTNKKALVGGASQGLGLAVAQQLAASGATVTVMARNEEKLRSVVATFPASQGQQHEYLVVDFADLRHYKLVVENYFRTHTVDILVNNTNGPKAGTVMEKTTTDYQAAFDLLFQTVQYTTELAIPHMKEQHFGRIINLTSRTVKEPVDNLVLSNTIRAALITWAKTLSRNVGKYQITVNNILTGNFDTERLNELFEIQANAQNTSPAAIKTQFIADIPLQRLGFANELAFVVAFLASEQAAYVNGTSIPVDGGLLKSI